MKKILELRPISPLSIGLDIGGTLTKISVILNKNSITNNFMFKYEFKQEIELNEQCLYLTYFPTCKFEPEVIKLLKKIKNDYEYNLIHATGGGAYKFSRLISDELNIKLEKHDELLSLVKGYIFMNSFNNFYEHTSNGNVKYVSNYDLEYPHLAVNVGSGVSVLLVNSINDIKRISGTLMGGGTLIGLSKLLINVDNYNDIMNLAKLGDNCNVDLVVGDIYGGNASSIGLDSNVIASSFGKINELAHNKRLDSIKKEDIAKSLLFMICFHIGQLTHLLVKQHKISKVYYFGNFSRKDSYAIEVLDYATKFWNKNLLVRFNKYDGFLGSIGTLID